MYSVLADAVLVLHFLFVLFVVLGGLLAVRCRWIVWAHIPAALWGVAIEVGGWICPLTPLENRLRALAGEPTYHGDFIARYLMPVIYPEGLTREMQVSLGFAALILNLLVYAIVLRRWRRPRSR